MNTANLIPAEGNSEELAAKNLARKRDERESAKEKEERKKSSTSTRLRRGEILEEKANAYFVEMASWQSIDALADKDPMGYNPERVPETWNTKMRLYFAIAKQYCYRKKSTKYSIPVIKEWVIYIDEIDYQFPDGTIINGNNYMRSLRIFFARYNRVALDKEREAEAGMKIAAKKAKEAAMKTPSEIADEQRHKKAAQKLWNNSDWEQCFEECANCIEENGKRRCACGNATPANRRARPIPARECAQYAPKAQIDE